MFNTTISMRAPAALAIFLAFPAQAQTALDAAIADGHSLTAEDISDMIVDHTVTARAGDRTFIFYYGPDNSLIGRMVGGEWSDAGYYGITDGDKVCLSMTPDKGRLRCMSLVARDGVVQKFNAAGELTFELLSFEEGNKL